MAENLKVNLGSCLECHQTFDELMQLIDRCSKAEVKDINNLSDAEQVKLLQELYPIIFELAKYQIDSLSNLSEFKVIHESQIKKRIIRWNSNYR